MVQDIHNVCPMCGALMGAEPQPAALRRAAEIQDQITRLRQRLTDAIGNPEAWRVQGAVLLCEPCQAIWVDVTTAGPNAAAARLEARIRELERQQQELARRVS